MEKTNGSRIKTRFLNDKLSFFIEAIARFCDKCGAPYSIRDLRIIQESDLSSIIHFSCSNCKSRHIATYLKPIGVSSRMPINTDLSVSEIAIAARRGEIPVDDILQIHNLLEKKGVVKI
jgi:hypothetical protein